MPWPMGLCQKFNFPDFKFKIIETLIAVRQTEFVFLLLETEILEACMIFNRFNMQKTWKLDSRDAIVLLIALCKLP